VTGSVPARAEQGRIIRDSPPFLELATVGAIVLIVGLNFSSVVAPVVTLVTVGVAYVLTLRLSGLVTAVFDVTSPSELEPVVVALLLGVVTDYVVFFCSALRHELVAGADRLQAAQKATVQFAPIIAVAGSARCRRHRFAGGRGVDVLPSPGSGARLHRRRRARRRHHDGPC